MSSRQSAIFDPTNPASPSAHPPEHTALILADYQNLIVPRLGPAGEETVIAAIALRDWARKHHIPIIFATVRTDQDPAPESKLAGVRGAGILNAVAADPTLAEVDARLLRSDERDASGVYYVSRRLGLVSVLSSEGLVDEVLARHGTRSLIVAGLSTSGCVLSTVRDGTEKGFVVTVVREGCADKPEVHEALMEDVLPMTAHVVSLEELEGLWDQEGTA